MHILFTGGKICFEMPPVHRQCELHPSGSPVVLNLIHLPAVYESVHH